MTITSAGHLVVGSTTSSGEFIVGSFTMSGDFLLGASEPPASTQIYPIIEYNEDTEMFQIVDTQKIHPVQIRSLSTGELVTTNPLPTPTFTVSVNGGTPTTETLTYSEFNATLLRHSVTVPDTLAVNAYDSVEINVSCDLGEGVTGEGFLMVNIVPDPATTGTTAQQVWEYAGDRTITGGSATGSGSEKVIPSANYTLDASAKTITLTSPYNTVTHEQVLLITDLTTGDLIYDSKNPTNHSIDVVDGVITYKYDGSGITSTPVSDKIQILVNMV